MTETLTICDCGHAPCFTTNDRLLLARCGYAHASGFTRDQAGFTRCYDCQTALDLAELAAWTPDRLPFFACASGADLNGNRWVTNWPGATLMRIVGSTVRRGRQPIEYIDCVDAWGAEWYGKGPYDSGTYTRLRRRKHGRRHGSNTAVMRNWPARPWTAPAVIPNTKG